MQQFQLKEPEPCSAPILYLSNLCEYELQNKIIVYVTKCHNECNDDGIGVLIHDKYTKFNGKHRSSWGFRYHKSLLLGDERNLTFTGTSALRAVRKCLEANRCVYSFDHYKEFLEFAIEHGAY